MSVLIDTAEIIQSDGWRMLPDAYAEQLSTTSLTEEKWHAYSWLRYVAERLRKSIMRGGARIIINAPPRHGKSELVSHWLPTWFFDLYPEQRIILASYGDNLSSSYGRKVRDELQYNKQTWTEVRTDKDAANDWETTKGGGMRTAGIGGGITGRGFNLGIVDDPHKNWAEASSATKRQEVIDWYKTTFSTRGEPGSSQVVVMTRWHKRDLTGFLLDEHEEDWELICLPAVAEENDLLGRDKGEPLCPERFDRKALKEKEKLGPIVWAGLFQQRPRPAGGNLVEEKWLRYWTELPEGLDQWIQSWDFMFKKTGKSWVVGQVWARLGPKAYLIDQVRARASFTESLDMVRDLRERWPQAIETVIEDKANGPAVMSMLEQEMSGLVEVIPYGSKEARMIAQTPHFKSGNVYFPHHTVAPWVGGFVDRLLDFPKGESDDEGDCCSQALNQYHGVPAFFMA